MTLTTLEKGKKVWLNTNTNTTTNTCLRLLGATKRLSPFHRFTITCDVALSGAPAAGRGPWSAVARSKLVLRISGVIGIDWGLPAVGIRSTARFIRSQGSVPLDVARKETIKSMIGTRAAPSRFSQPQPAHNHYEALTPSQMPLY